MVPLPNTYDPDVEKLRSSCSQENSENRYSNYESNPHQFGLSNASQIRIHLQHDFVRYIPLQQGFVHYFN